MLIDIADGLVCAVNLEQSITNFVAMDSKAPLQVYGLQSCVIRGGRKDGLGPGIVGSRAVSKMFMNITSTLFDDCMRGGSDRKA